MTGQFAGFLVLSITAHPAIIPDGPVWREIAGSFSGVGLLVHDFIGRSVQEHEIRMLALSLGFSTALKWVFLQYVCWACQIEFICGVGVSVWREFNPIEVSESGGYSGRLCCAYG